MNQQLLNQIALSELKPNIFSEVAFNIAQEISPDRGQMNKSTQIRKFYDELLMWHEKVNLESGSNQEFVFQNSLPFIQMLKAKVAYAKGRKHVDDNFKVFFDKLIEEIKSPTSLKHAKLFFEAVLGFRKSFEIN